MKIFYQCLLKNSSVYNDRAGPSGLEPETAVLETAVLPIKL